MTLIELDYGTLFPVYISCIQLLIYIIIKMYSGSDESSLPSSEGGSKTPSEWEASLDSSYYVDSDGSSRVSTFAGSGLGASPAPCLVLPGVFTLPNRLNGQQMTLLAESLLKLEGHVKKEIREHRPTKWTVPRGREVKPTEHLETELGFLYPLMRPSDRFRIGGQWGFVRDNVRECRVVADSLKVLFKQFREALHQLGIVDADDWGFFAYSHMIEPNTPAQIDHQDFGTPRVKNQFFALLLPVSEGAELTQFGRDGRYESFTGPVMFEGNVWHRRPKVGEKGRLVVFLVASKSGVDTNHDSATPYRWRDVESAKIDPQALSGESSSRESSPVSCLDRGSHDGSGSLGGGSSPSVERARSQSFEGSSQSQSVQRDERARSQSFGGSSISSVDGSPCSAIQMDGSSVIVVDSPMSVGGVDTDGIITNLSASMSDSSLDSSATHPPFAWDSYPHAESDAAYRFYAGMLGRCGFGVCEVQRSVLGPNKLPVITLTKGATVSKLWVEVNVRAAKQTVLELCMFVAPQSALGELVPQADINELSRPGAWVDFRPYRQTLRCGCLGLPDITGVNMLQFYEVVGADLREGVKLWIQPSVIGRDLEKLLAYVFREGGSA